MFNWIVMALSTIVAVLPSLLQTFDPYPKLKIALTVLGLLAAGFLAEFKKSVPSTSTPDRQKDAGFTRIGPLAITMLVGLLAWTGVALTIQGCATTSKFANVVVECTEDTIANNPTIASNVRACLADATAGGYMACLNLLPFGVQDIICIVSELSRGTALAMNTGDVDPVTATINRNANEFLRTNNVSRK